MEQVKAWAVECHHPNGKVSSMTLDSREKAEKACEQLKLVRPEAHVRVALITQQKDNSYE